MTLDEKDELGDIAKYNGFDTISSYLRWLIKIDVPKDIKEIKNLLQKNQLRNISANLENNIRLPPR